jgi:hypothetical protein
MALGKAGQSTVEYLLVGLALLAVIMALGLFAGRLRDGVFSEHASNSASHSMGEASAGALGDVLLY